MPVAREVFHFIRHLGRAAARRPLLLVALAATLGFAACRDSRDITAPAARGGAAALETTLTLDQEINSLITQLFPPRLQTFVRLQWNHIKMLVDRNPDGKPTARIKLALNALVSWMKANETQLNNVLGETRHHMLVRLVLDMLLYVYNGPDTPPPPMSPTSDVGIGTVSPTATTTTTITTPEKEAVIEFPAGSVDELTTVILEQDNTPYPENCSGPMRTRRCQYPQFYKAHVFPDERLNVAARVGVCHVNSGTKRLPLRDGEFHDRFRLAHDLPADPANYHPDGVQEDGIEILPLIHLESTVMDCTGDSYDVAFMRTRPGAIGNILDRAEWLAKKTVARAGRLLTPKNAYAIDQGGGGELFFFSSIGVVDPESAPDLTPHTFTVQELEVNAGETVHITALSQTNIGTASAGATQASVRFSSDETITSGDLELATQAWLPVVPNAIVPGTPLAVVIPAGTAPGVYYLGLLADATGVAAEENEQNNSVSVPLTVRRLPSTTTVTCAEGPFTYTGEPQTPCTATVVTGDATQHPPVTYANNTNAGLATASYAFPGDATYAPSEGSATFVIDKSASQTTVRCPVSVFYNGAPQTPCTATATGPALNVAVPVTYANNVNEGRATATANYAGGDNHLPSAGTASFDILNFLFGVSGNDVGGADLVRINPVTGTSTLIGNVGPFVMPGLAFDASTGTLYGGQGAGNPLFRLVDQTTGAASLIGNSGLGFAALSALTVRRSDNVLFASVNIAGDGGTGADHLAIIDKATGHATVIGSYGDCEGVPTPATGAGICTIEGLEGIAFDPAGNLWGVHSLRGRAGPPGLYKIDPATGKATFQGALLDPTGNVFGKSLVSIAITPDGVVFAGTGRTPTTPNDGGYLVRIDLATKIVTVLGRSILTGSALAGLAVPR